MKTILSQVTGEQEHRSEESAIVAPDFLRLKQKKPKPLPRLLHENDAVPRSLESDGRETRKSSGEHLDDAPGLLPFQQGVVHGCSNAVDDMESALNFWNSHHVTVMRPPSSTNALPTIAVGTQRSKMPSNLLGCSSQTLLDETIAQSSVQNSERREITGADAHVSDAPRFVLVPPDTGSISLGSRPVLANVPPLPCGEIGIDKSRSTTAIQKLALQHDETSSFYADDLPPESNSAIPEREEFEIPKASGISNTSTLDRGLYPPPVIPRCPNSETASPATRLSTGKDEGLLKLFIM